LRELNVADQPYQVVLAAISEGGTATEGGRPVGVSRQTEFDARDGE